MKKIAVLTDFSETAANAAHYGFKLAAALQVDLLLYNCFVVPSAEPVAAQITWPLDEYDTLRESSSHGLRKLSAELHKLDDLLPETSRIPTIHCLSHDSGFSLNLADLIFDPNIELLIAGTHHQGLSATIMGNHVRQLIDTLNVPLLIIPPTTSFRPWTDVVWASELQATELPRLPLLANLLQPFKATLTIAHVLTNANQTTFAAEPFAEAVRKIVAPVSVIYRDTYSADLTRGIRQIYQHIALDVLVMIHHRRGMVAQLFGRSQSKLVAKDLQHPLLIIPE